MQADPLHPLATILWEKCCTVPGEGQVHSECVLWNSKIYVGLVHKGSKTDAGDEIWTPKLLVFSSDVTSWEVITTLPIREFALTTYRSKLVLVGGRDQRSFVTNKLWTSDDATNWQPSLPPMPTKRFSPVAVNIGTPEYLVVLGGMTNIPSINCLAAVEVLVEEQWFKLWPLPLSYYNIRHTLHNGNLFIIGSATAVGISILRSVSVQ